MPQTTMPRNWEQQEPQGVLVTEVVADHLDEHGAGVAPFEDGVVHVVDLLPGERAEVVVEHRSPHRAEAWGFVRRRIGELSPHRVAPACPASGRCGGCTWQHLDSDFQLREKHGRVARAVAGLEAVRQGAVEVKPVAPAPQPLGYRNKGKYVAASVGGVLTLGAYVPRTHEVVETIGCQVVMPIIDEVAAWTRGAAQAEGLTPYSEQRRTGELRYVIIRANHVGEVLVGLVTPTKVSRQRIEPVAAALGRHPAVQGVVWVTHDRTDGALVPHDARRETVAGESTLLDRVAEVPIRVGIGEFLQVNRDHAASMYARIAELAEAGPTTRAIDLFAGVGGISFSLARAGASVQAIEIDSIAVAALTAAAHSAEVAIEAIVGDAALVASGSAPVDVIVVNPPRKGLAPAALAAVLSRSPRTIIYVSCGPESLGRDLALLEKAGYRVDAIEPFDLMPGTGQVETVVRARRS